MRRSSVTINDVARKGGVSKVTVSYVLNGRQTGIRISDDTRQRVLAAARELGYHPNALARGLAGRRTNTLALVMQYPSVFSGWSGFTNELMHGATDKACELGYDLMLHTSAQLEADQEAAALADGRVDGALLLRDRDDPLGALLADRGFPYVYVFCRGPGSNDAFVDCDNIGGGKMAVDHLLQLGHRRILHIAGSPRSVAAADRRAGYRMALEQAGIDFRPEWECEITYSGASFSAFLDRMSAAEPPTAVFAWSDDVAMRAICLLRENLGRRVPDDVAVVGFDGTLSCEHTQPRLTSVRQPIYEMAARGVEALAAELRGESGPERHSVFSPELSIRDSCGFPYAGRSAAAAARP